MSSTPIERSRGVTRLVSAAVAAVLSVTLLVGCGSDGKKSSTAKGQEQAASTEKFARLDPAAFSHRMGDKDAVLINVHIPYEGELENTDAFIPFDKILSDDRLPKDKDTEVLLYCRSGRMSEEAGAALHDAGYTNVGHLEGGMRGWESAGKPLIQDPAHAEGSGSGSTGHM